MNWYDMMQWMGSNLIQNTWITQAATGCQRRKGPGCQPQPTHPLAGAPATRWWLHLVAYIEMMTSHGFESMAQLGKMTEQKGGWTAITAWFPAAQVGWAISIFYNHHLSTILSKFHFCLSNCSFQVIASAATNIGYLRITPLGYMITQKYTGMPHKSGQRSKFMKIPLWMMHFLDNYMLIWYHYLLVLHPQTVLGLSTDRIATGVNILPNDTKISGHNWCFEIGERLHTQPTPAKKNI